MYVFMYLCMYVHFFNVFYITQHELHVFTVFYLVWVVRELCIVSPAVPLVSMLFLQSPLSPPPLAPDLLAQHYVFCRVLDDHFLLYTCFWPTTSETSINTNDGNVRIHCGRTAIFQGCRGADFSF